MHPILADRHHLGVYLASWMTVGGMLVVLLAATGRAAVGDAALLLLPMALLGAFLCLAAWYPVRAQPPGRVPLGRWAPVHGTSAVVTTAVWLAAGLAWARALERLAGRPGPSDLLRDELPLLAATGLLLYLLATAVHALLVAFGETRLAERRALEARVLAREAELQALKAQIDPHFLFNCLNSIASLAGRQPAEARSMSTRLAGFLRSSLDLGSQSSISLAEELDLGTAYLEIERVRFGDRLAFRLEADEACRAVAVPPLVLQPLLENAVKHGVAGRVEGGAIALVARRGESALEIEITNACDDDPPPRQRTGIGLANVRERLRLLYGAAGRLEAGRHEGRFRVRLWIPLPSRHSGEERR